MVKLDYVITRVQVIGVTVYADDEVGGRRKALGLVQGYLDHDEELEEERREAAEMTAEHDVPEGIDRVTHYDSRFVVRPTQPGQKLSVTQEIKAVVIEDHSPG